MKDLFALADTAKIRKVSAFKNTENKEPIYYDNQDLYGLPKTFYSNEFIELIDKVIVEDNLHLMSLEQQEYFEKYLAEASTITLEDNETGNIEILPSNIQELDATIGSYTDYNEDIGL